MLLPEALVAALRTAPGFDEDRFKEVHASGGQLTSIRLNPAKPAALSFPATKIPWSTNGRYLEQRPSFTLDPLLHGGAYYVQEASSMFLEEAIKQTVDLSSPLKVLDLCAAPGGKSTLLQSVILEESLLVSNEVIKTRVNILEENITKWGAANVVVTNNDAKDFQRLQQYFDCIVVDAPCSGSGLFRKDPAAVEEWSENNVLLCSQRQQRILADVMPALKNGGVLIYATCSYSTEEDEMILDWLVNEFSLVSCPLQTKGEWGIIETTTAVHQAKGYRFYPDKVKGEGFFIAALKKQDGINEKIKVTHKQKAEKVTAKELTVIGPWLSSPQQMHHIRINNEIIALPLHVATELPVLQSALYIKKAGVKLGTVIRDELIPDHELAVSTVLHNSIPAVEMTLEEALQYLRKENIILPPAAKGWAAAKYQGIALGWVKILPNRVNNYYPAGWRILNK